MNQYAQVAEPINVSITQRSVPNRVLQIPLALEDNHKFLGQIRGLLNELSNRLAPVSIQEPCKDNCEKPTPLPPVATVADKIKFLNRELQEIINSIQDSLRRLDL